MPLKGEFLKYWKLVIGSCVACQAEYRYDYDMIRPATVSDVPAIAALINTYAERGLMLFRSHADLYESVRDFVVAADPDQAVIGVAALEIAWADLAEIRSLAVAPTQRGRGLGRQLVEACVADARHLRIQKVFALTYEEKFFHRLGFSTVEKAALPLKVWSTCMQCPKRMGCDEIAVVRQLFDAPVISEADPDADVALRYDVPTAMVQLGVRRA